MSSAANAAAYIVTPMTATDLDGVAELERGGRLSFWGREAYAAELERDDSIMFIARPAHRINSSAPLLGFIATRLMSDELHINNIAVNDAWRGQGIGGALLREALRQAVSINAKWAVLEVRASNTPALNLYRRFGFSLLGRRRNYYSAPPEDAMIMGINL